MRRLFVVMISLLIVQGFIVAPAAQAQTYPNRPIQLIHSGTPGQMMDIPCRIFTDELSKILGTSIVVTGKPGASHTLGPDAVVRSKKDGYTILYTSSSGLVYAPITTPKIVPYDGFKDLELLGAQVILPFTVTVQAESPWKTFAELIDFAKKNPGKVRYGSLGVATIESFNLQIIETLTGAKFTLVPLTTHPAVSLLGGHIESIGSPISEVHTYVSSGKMRVLLISSKNSKAPGVPTLTGLGYPQDIISGWHAFLAPSGIPEEARKVLVPAIRKVMENPEIKAKIDNLALSVDYKTPAEFKKMWEAEYQRSKDIAVRLGLVK
jgi:tripartite-type tricarboxylate transporter receptor subunit TctC